MANEQFSTDPEVSEPQAPRAETSKRICEVCREAEALAGQKTCHLCHLALIDHSLKIALGLEQLQAIGDLMSCCDEEEVEGGTIIRLGQLVRDKAEEIRRLWDEESEARMSLIRELKRKVREANPSQPQ